MRIIVMPPVRTYYLPLSLAIISIRCQHVRMYTRAINTGDTTSLNFEKPHISRLYPCDYYYAVLNLSKMGVCHSPVDFRTHSRAYPRSLPLTPACADARISTGE